MSNGADVRQDQFLAVMSRDAAVKAFRDALVPQTPVAEEVALDDLAGRVLAQDVAAAVDAPPFDRSVVDGFAVRADDLSGASAARPVTLTLSGESIACGHAPRVPVLPGRLTPIATGAPLPRGADAVVMIEHTDPHDDGRIAVGRSVAPGQNVAFAGSDIAQGETLLRAGTLIGAREIGLLAAVGLDRARVRRQPRVAVLSTGDELVRPGHPLGPAQIYDSNGPIVAAAVAETGCIPVPFGAVPDDPALLEAAIREAYRSADAVILSGGTSKGAGDLTTRIVAGLGPPGIVAHGVALKPGKPLCLAVCDGKPVVVLPGFPTSAMFTFHDVVAPVLRELAGLPRREDATLDATLPVRLVSEAGRTEFVMVSLFPGPDGPVAYPVGKGSGSVTAFSQADGFVAVDALTEAVPARSAVRVTLFSKTAPLPDLVIMGSHCVGLDAVVSALLRSGLTARVMAQGSLGGLSALGRGECDVAPIHLLDPATGAYNRAFLPAGAELVEGWRRMQGVVFRPNDRRFAGQPSAEAAVAAALADPGCLMVNRNQGAGTRVLIDALLAGRRPPGHSNQPRSHNAVAAAVAQGRADWGVAIASVAASSGLGFLPLAEEHYDFAVLERPGRAAALAAFRAALVGAEPEIRAFGFTRA